MNSITDKATWLAPDSRKSAFFRPRRLLLVADFLSGCVAFGSAYMFLRTRGVVEEQLTISVVTALAILIFSVAFLLRSRQYSAPRRLDVLSSIGILLRDVVMAAATTTLLSYLTKGFFTGLTSPSRLAIGTTVVVFTLSGILARVTLGAVQRRQYSAGTGIRRILVAGDGTTADELMQMIDERPQLGVLVAGQIRLAVAEWPERSAAALALSDDMLGLQRLDQALRASQADEVVIALDPDAQPALPRLAAFLNLAHVPFRVVPSLFEDTYRTSELLGQTQIPVVDLAVNPLDRLGRITKRTMDITLAILVLLVLLPFELIAILAIVIDDGRPVIFAQHRVGKNGRRFVLYKFRTMVKDAEEKLKEVQAQNELATSEGLMFKMSRDPRITRVGGLLRRLSFDELPQFINVLKGDMSVVGPRPPLPREVANYERDHLSRLRVLPGITGLWQVSGRNELSFEDMVALDRYYVDNWSAWTDARIIMKTFSAIVSRKGAY